MPTAAEVVARLNTYRQAVATLHEALSVATPSVLERDGTLQRFEYVHELTWKTMKVLLQFGGVRDLRFPREIYLKAVTFGLISADLPWVDMLKDRNYLSHMYWEAKAEAIFSRLPGYLAAFETFHQTAQSKVNDLS